MYELQSLDVSSTDIKKKYVAVVLGAWMMIFSRSLNLKEWSDLG